MSHQGLLQGRRTNSGTVEQRIELASSANVTSAVVIPFDGTIPQITEGAQLLTQNITPTNAANTLIIDFYGWLEGGNLLAIAALFKDGAANAILSTAHDFIIGNSWTPVFFRYALTAGGTASQTYELRFGPAAAGTIQFNPPNLGASTTFNFSITEVLP